MQNYIEAQITQFLPSRKGQSKEYDEIKRIKLMLSDFESKLKQLKSDISILVKSTNDETLEFVINFGKEVNESIRYTDEKANYAQKEAVHNDKRITKIEETLNQIQKENDYSQQRNSKQEQQQKEMIKKIVRKEIMMTQMTAKKRRIAESNDDYFFKTVQVSNLGNYDVSLSERENAAKVLRTIQSELQLKKIEKVSFSKDKQKVRLTYRNLNDAIQGVKSMVAKKKACFPDDNGSKMVFVRMSPPRCFESQRALYNEAMKRKRQGKCKHFFLFTYNQKLAVKMFMTDGTFKIIEG